jgi:hypothetical protein
MEAKRLDARGLVSHLAEAADTLRARTILAPAVSGGRIRVRLEGLVYTFRVREEHTGWGHFQPLDERTATYLGEALPWEREAYLALLPALRVILLWPDADQGEQGTWLAVPANAGEARQRFGWSMDPRPVYLCDPTDGAGRFETVLARVDGHTLWYGGPDVRADPLHAAWLREAAQADELPEHKPSGLPAAARHALLLDHLRRIEQTTRQETEDERAALAAALGVSRAGRARHARNEQEQIPSCRYTGATLEQRLRRALAMADAQLHSFSELESDSGAPQLLVEWSRQGERFHYRSLLATNLTVVASGICLSGRDADFDLTSLVSVMDTD